jgi:hypothetical protein
MPVHVETLIPKIIFRYDERDCVIGEEMKIGTKERRKRKKEEGEGENQNQNQNLELLQHFVKFELLP